MKMKASMKTYVKAALSLIVSLCTLASVSCRREPLHEMADHIELRFDISLSEQDSAMWVKPTAPHLMKVIFYDTETRDRVAEMYCGPSGGSVYGLLPEHSYDMIAYNYDVENTLLEHEENFNLMLAYTKSLPSTGDNTNIISEPEHLLVGRKTGIVIPFLAVEDTTYVIETHVSTILDSYSIRIDSIKGLENASSVDLYLTGHSRSNTVGPDLRSDVSSTLHIGTCRPDPTYTYLYAEFCTFGKIAGETGLARLSVVVTGAGGTTYYFEQDITEQYLRPDHRLLLNIRGEIKPREQGGFMPRVDDWNPKIEDITLE